MTIYVLLKGRNTSGRFTFHGVTDDEAVAEAWMAAGASAWYQECEQDGDTANFEAIQAKPICNPPDEETR